MIVILSEDINATVNHHQMDELWSRDIQPVTGTQGVHYVVPVDTSTIQTKNYSDAPIHAPNYSTHQLLPREQLDETGEQDTAEDTRMTTSNIPPAILVQ